VKKTDLQLRPRFDPLGTGQIIHLESATALQALAELNIIVFTKILPFEHTKKEGMKMSVSKQQSK
jgi:hypothetical protein